MANKPTKQTGNKNNSSARGGSIAEQKLRSIWLEGAEKSKSIQDSFGKSLDQIGSQIREKHLTKIESAFKDYTKGDGLLGNLFKKLDIGSYKSKLDEIKAYADEAKVYYDAAQKGLEVYKEVKNGNYGALTEFLGPYMSDGLKDAVNYGIEGYDAIKNTDFKNFNDVMNLASKLTGVDIPSALGITQLQAEVSALLAVAQKYNIPNAIKMLREKFGDKPHLNNDMIRGISMNANLGQFDMLEEMLKIMDSKTILLMNPDIIKRILSNYRFPIKYKEDMMKAEQKRVLDVLTKLDPNWDKEIIEGKTYYLLSPWDQASQDAITLFQHHPIYGGCICIGSTYPAVTLREGLNKTYPYLQL